MLKCGCAHINRNWINATSAEKRVWTRCRKLQCQIEQKI